MIPNIYDFSNFMIASDAIESIFLLYIILQFFKSFAPEGGGDLVKPIR